MRLAVIGTGRLGRLVAQAARQHPGFELVWTAGREGPEGRPPAQVAVDVSHADAVPAHLAWAARTGTPLVLGVTGYDPAALADPTLVRSLQEGDLGVLLAPNFSLTVALMRHLTAAIGRYATAHLPDADLAVHERHHRAKVDAPSGTAVLLAQTLQQVSRPQATAASAAEDAPAGDPVQVSSQRLGAEVGFHEVRLQTDLESLVISHQAHQREVFAQGALVAAQWIKERPGLHTFDDLAAEMLEPLFAPTRAAAARVKQT